MLAKIDCFITGIFQRFANWFQKRTGKTNFFLSRVAALAAVKAMLGAALYGASDKHWFIFGKEVVKMKAGYMWIFAVFILLGDAFWVSEHNEKRALENLDRGIASRFKSPGIRLIRLLLLLIAILETILLPVSLPCVAIIWPIVCWFFFYNCAPLPASKK